MYDLKNAPVDLVAAIIYIYFLNKFFLYYKTMPLQVDRGLWAKSEGYGESGCVLPEVQLLPLWGGREEPK